MKKIISVLLIVGLVAFAFAGCQTAAPSAASETSDVPNEIISSEASDLSNEETSNSASTETPAKTFHIGLIQFVEHTSLDEIRDSFIQEIEQLAKEKNIEVVIDYKNALGESSMTYSICRTFVQNEVDIIVAIATPSAQAAAEETTNIPIIFSAVTDPIAVGLLENFDAPEGNITGVSDAINVESIFALAEELTPGIEHYGLLYNQMEVNSVSVIAEAKAYLESKNIQYTEKIVTNSSEVDMASRILVEQCDAIFVPIDNTVASVMNVVADTAIERQVPVYVAADSMVRDGGLATVGVNYVDLGQRTATMTMAVLEGAEISSLPVQVMQEGRPVVNEETAGALGISVEQYVD